MKVIRGIGELRATTARARAGGAKVGLVPTMGALHDGHLSLIDRARAAADVAVVSVFVNPLQFGASEDLEVYPRDLDGDAALASARGADLLFAPAAGEMYPEGEPLVTVDPGALGEGLCGAYRPGHFRGVLTVVAKLLGLVRPHVAVFGRKDFQQSVLIRRMVSDLNMDVEILAAPIVREPDGLALSSRNLLLDDAERGDAALISEGLRLAAREFERGNRGRPALVGAYLSAVARGRRLRPQYQEVVSADDLSPLQVADHGAVLAVAAHCGETRLIDNIVLGEADGL